MERGLFPWPVSESWKLLIQETCKCYTLQNIKSLAIEKKTPCHPFTVVSTAWRCFLLAEGVPLFVLINGRTYWLKRESEREILGLKIGSCSDHSVHLIAEWRGHPSLKGHMRHRRTCLSTWLRINWLRKTWGLTSIFIPTEADFVAEDLSLLVWPTQTGFLVPSNRWQFWYVFRL